VRNEQQVRSLLDLSCQIMMYSPERLKILSFAALAAPNQKYGDVTAYTERLKKIEAATLRRYE
jgi:hypothetical protein